LCRLGWEKPTQDDYVGHRLGAVSFSPSGAVLAGRGLLVAGERRPGPRKLGVRLWEVATGKQQRLLSVRINFGRRNGILLGRMPEDAPLLFSPDGRYLAVADAGAVRLWELPGGKEVRRFVGPQALLDALAFSPNGELLAAHTEGGEVWLWEVATGTALSRLPLGDGCTISAMCFTPDGKGLACAEADANVLVWNVAWLLEQARAAKPVRPATKLEVLWADLASADATKGADASTLLAAQPAEATALLKTHLRPLPSRCAGAHRSIARRSGRQAVCGA
jgi:WD40 repeat protein